MGRTKKTTSNFGGIVRKERLKRKMTLREVAGMAGISHPFLSDIETGRRIVTKDQTLEKLCDVLDLDNGLAYEAICKDMGELRVKIGDGETRDRILLALARSWISMTEEQALKVAELLESFENS